MTVTILMPMAGRGSRFAREGQVLPKPLVPVFGVPMFRLALASVRRTLPNARLVCIVLAEHDAKFQLAGALRQADPKAEIVTIAQPTGGTMETCLAAESAIEPGSLIILDCDLTFASAAYDAHLRDLEAGRYPADGMLLSFRSNGPQFSYAELAGDRVIRTAEKQVISDRALIGSYGFSDAARFFGLAHDIVDRMQLSGNGEYYVSSAYNRLIETGGVVQLRDVDRYWSVGTPEELRTATNDPAFQIHLRDLGLIAPNGTPLP